jgi:hypothetical protein
MPLVAPEARAEYTQMQRQKAPQPGEKVAPDAIKESHDQGLLWLEEDGFVRPIKVKMGLSDRNNTEVTADEIQDGTQVVVGEKRERSAKPEETTNPFTPKFFSGKKQ